MRGVDWCRGGLEEWAEGAYFAWIWSDNYGRAAVRSGLGATYGDASRNGAWGFAYADRGETGGIFFARAVGGDGWSARRSGRRNSF